MTRESTRRIAISTNDVVAVSGTSAQSAAFPGPEVMLVSTTDCWIAFGTSPTAVVGTDANQFLPANVVWTIKWTPGDKVGVIQNVASGFLTVTNVGY